MPTIGVYVAMPVTRALAERWKLQTGDPALQEVIRSIVAEALDKAAGQVNPERKFETDCANVEIHKRNFRCRLCGGSS